MPQSQPPQEHKGPPAAFVAQVRDALEHLYDLAYLQRHPLTAGGIASSRPPAEMAGQRLRRELAAAIEALNPGPQVPFGAPQARLYNVLRLRYVEHSTVRETAHELGLSLRQAHRDLRHGEESLAVILWARLSAPPPEEPDDIEISSLQAEMARLEARPSVTDLRVLLQQALNAVAQQSAQRQVHVHVNLPEGPATVSTDRTMAEQVLLNTLSYAVQQAQPGTLRLTVRIDETHVSLVLRYLLEPEAAGTPVASLVVAQLADRLGWTMTQEDRQGDVRVVTLSIPAHGHTVLVIDDNEGLVELLVRYLTDHACRVIAAANGQEGLKLAQELSPDAIILDVMMPEMHGWEVLQRLRTHPRTAQIPVIVCSVISNPALAYSLGASLVIAKPVSRDAVLAALRQLDVA